MADPAVLGGAGVTATVMGALGLVIRHLEKKQMARSNGNGGNGGNGGNSVIGKLDLIASKLDALIVNTREIEASSRQAATDIAVLRDRPR